MIQGATGEPTECVLVAKQALQGSQAAVLFSALLHFLKYLIALAYFLWSSVVSPRPRIRTGWNGLGKSEGVESQPVCEESSLSQAGSWPWQYIQREAGYSCSVQTWSGGEVLCVSVKTETNCSELPFPRF